MGLWGSFRAHPRPLTAERKKLYTYDELLKELDGMSGIRWAENVAETLFSEPKHRELDRLVYNVAFNGGSFVGLYSAPKDDWSDVWYEVRQKDLDYIWHNLLVELRQELENDWIDPFIDHEFRCDQDRLRLQEEFGRLQQLLVDELPAMYRIRWALSQGKVVYYSTSK